ncbi:MAG: DUF2007 domain-containing protein [Peptococcaceae bacterium]|nr:DUF2007 domain-containing protein [Peptococcaceae bacterium]
MERLVTVGRYSNPAEARIVQGLLNSRGIECCILDELSAAYTPLAVGGIRLAVRQGDLERATKILSEKKA